MYIVEIISKSESELRVAAGSQRELLGLLHCLDRSEYVIAWRIEGHKPSTFGWADRGWYKYSEVFTTEHYKQSR